MGCLKPVMGNTLIVTASEYRFISENGIVAILGDEDQFVKGDICEINRTLSFERGHVDQMRGNGRVRSKEWLSCPWVSAVSVESSARHRFVRFNRQIRLPPLKLLSRLPVQIPGGKPGRSCSCDPSYVPPLQ